MRPRLMRRIVETARGLRGRDGSIPLAEITPYLPAAPVVVEAGAHIGIDTVRIARHWPEGQVYAFEPVPEIFQKLQRRVGGLPNVACFELALGGWNGVEELHVSGGASDASSSLLKPKEHLRDHPDVAFSTSVQVDVVTLDSWAAAHGVEQVDFLWLDMQGLELAVLQAAEGLLEGVAAIHTEVSLRETYEGVSLYPELKTWLEERGFVMTVEHLPWQDMGNVLFVRA